MIVNKSSKGLHIIFQASHGLLSGKIAEQLKVKYRPELWLDTLIAVVEHDDLQLDFDEKNYLSKQGIPLDFTEDKTEFSKLLKRAKRVFAEAKSKSLWTAMLVSYHLDFLYGAYKSKNKKAKHFLDEQETFRKEIVSHFGISEKEASSYYEIVRFCDRCSLILCKGETPDNSRKLEINTSLENKTHFIHRKDNGKLSITPWCFEKDGFEVSVEETVLKQFEFKNQRELKDFLKNTARNKLVWQFEK